jgi:hypothetical protein
MNLGLVNEKMGNGMISEMGYKKAGKPASVTPLQPITMTLYDETYNIEKWEILIKLLTRKIKAKSDH